MYTKYRTHLAALLCSLMLGAAGMVLAQENPAYTLNIDSQPLKEALKDFAEQSGLQIVFYSDLAAGFKAPAVKGTLTTDEALGELLKNTQLTYRRINSNTVEVSEAGARKTSLNPEWNNDGLRLAEETSASRNAASEATDQAGAQSADPSDSPLETNAQLEEVVVTAQKREQRLQDVPVSLTALGSDLMERAAITRVTDLEKLVPNFSFDTAFGVAQDARVTIRGIVGSARNAGFESSVSVFVDGVYAGRPVAQNLNLVNVERVEVLRGPQGTLFGKNTIAGAVNIITRKPGESFEGKVSANIGNYDKRNFNGYVSGALVDDKLFAGASFFSNDRDGYVKNLFDGHMLGTENAYGGDLQLRYLATSDLEANFRFDYLKDDNNGVYTETLDGTSNIPGGVIYSPGIRTINLNSTPFERREVYGASLTLDYAFGGHTFTSVSAYRNSDSIQGGDNDNSPLDFLDVLGWKEDLSFLSQEFRLASPTGGKFDYLLGAYLFRQSLASEVPFVSGVARASPGLATVFGDIDTESGALFAQGNYHVSDRLTLTGGLRYTVERRELNEFRAVGPIGFGGVFHFPNQTDDRKDSDVSPMASLTYAVTDDINVYGKAARGFKSGGWNIEFLSRPDQTPPPRSEIIFEPEVATTYEIGFKSALLGRRIVLNVAAFRTDYKDLQVQSRIANPLLPGIFTSVFNNAASSVIEGVEVEWSARFLKGLSLRGGIGYTDAIFDSFEAATVIGGVPVSFTGNRLPDAPKWNGSAMLEYERPLVADKTLSFSFDYSYKGDFFTDPGNNPLLLVDSHRVVGGRIGIASDTFDVFLWGENLTDENYLLTRQLGAVLRGTWNMPRTYGVQVSYKFR
jgi:iron complex outermembrane recepter protein